MLLLLILIRDMARLIGCEVHRTLRQPGDALGGVAFFILIMLVLPLILIDRSNPNLAPDTIAPLLWLGMMLALLPALARLFHDDWAEGVWEAMLASTHPLIAILTARLIASCITLLIPLLVAMLVFALAFGIDPASLPRLGLAFTIGCVCFVLIGAMAGALSLGARNSQILSAVIIVPLALPVLIFGSAISGQAVAETHQTPQVYGAWQFLLAEFLLLLALSPIITATAMGFAEE